MLKAALKQIMSDDGLDAFDILTLSRTISGTKVLTLSVQAENACAEGFIELTTADALNYDLKNFSEHIRSILNDTAKENADCIYDYTETLKDGTTVTFQFSLTY